MSLVKKKNMLIHIPVYYTEKEIRGYSKITIIKEEEKAKKMMEDEATKNEIKCNNFHFCIFNWDMQKEIQKSCYYFNPESGQQTLDWVKARDMKLTICLKKWDLKDEEGNDLPINIENIGALQPEIVNVLLDAFDEIVAVSADYSKN